MVYRKKVKRDTSRRRGEERNTFANCVKKIDHDINDKCWTLDGLHLVSFISNAYKQQFSRLVEFWEKISNGTNSF